MRKRTWKAISIILVGIMVLQIAGPLVSPMITAFIDSVIKPSTNHASTYLGQCTRRAYMPALVLYDPPGDGSYQQLTRTSTLSMTSKFHLEVGGYMLAAVYMSYESSTSYECSLLESYTSSQSDSPSDMGPGKGDSVVGSVYDITWDVWLNGTNPDGSNIYTVRPVSQSLIGSFIYSRADLAARTTTEVKDRTGEGGNVNYYWSISANRTVEKEVTYKWANERSMDFTVGVQCDFGWCGFTFLFGYTFDFTTENGFSIAAHYFDSGKRISFYESADSGFRNSLGINEVDSSVHWYSPSDDTPPVISTPPSFTDYVQGSKGHSITWNAGDKHPNYYEIDRTFQSSTTTVSSDTWYFNGSITYNIDGLMQPGTYTYTCRVYDMELNHASSSVNVTVIPDTTPPTIDQPLDVTYPVYTLGSNITWHPRDDEPLWYQITVDAVPQPSQPWNGGDVLVQLDSVAVGTHTYTCTVTDAGNNTISDTVNVIVTPDTRPRTVHELATGEPTNPYGVSSTQSGIYTDTHTSNDVYQVLQSGIDPYLGLPYMWCEYSFQFTEAPRGNVTQLAWSVEAKTSAPSDPYLYIYVSLYNYGTGSWNDVTTLSNTESTIGGSVDINSYMDSAGNMRIRFWGLRAEPFTVSVDYMYWAVTYSVA